LYRLPVIAGRLIFGARTMDDLVPMVVRGIELLLVLGRMEGIQKKIIKDEDRQTLTLSIILSYKWCPVEEIV
jgi:hypothetical protein